MKEWIPMPRYQMRKHLILSLLEKENCVQKKCLEIGFGAGDLLNEYSRFGFETYGFDFGKYFKSTKKS